MPSLTRSLALWPASAMSEAELHSTPAMPLVTVRAMLAPTPTHVILAASLPSFTGSVFTLEFTGWFLCAHLGDVDVRVTMSVVLMPMVVFVPQPGRRTKDRKAAPVPAPVPPSKCAWKHRVLRDRLKNANHIFVAMSSLSSVVLPPFYLNVLLLNKDEVVKAKVRCAHPCSGTPFFCYMNRPVCILGGREGTQGLLWDCRQAG